MTQPKDRIAKARAIVAAIKEASQEATLRPAPSADYAKARERAVAFIGFDACKSRAKVQQCLEAEGYDPQLIAQVIQDLLAMDYLNDRRAGERVLRRHAGRKYKGDRYYQHAMQALHIPREQISALLESLPSEAERLELVLPLHEVQGLDRRSRERLLRRMQGRGFGLSLLLRHLEGAKDA